MGSQSGSGCKMDGCSAGDPSLGGQVKGETGRRPAKRSSAAGLGWGEGLWEGDRRAKPTEQGSVLTVGVGAEEPLKSRLRRVSSLKWRDIEDNQSKCHA